MNDKSITEERKSGRPKGSLNASTRKAREAISRFVDSAAPHLMEWLQQTAYGIPKVDAEGQLLRDAAGSIIWVNKPNPEAAIKAFSDICEYHIPKLSRADIAVAARVEHQHLEPGQMNAEQLQAELLRSLGFGQQLEGEIIDVTPEPVAAEQKTPDWLK